MGTLPSQTFYFSPLSDLYLCQGSKIDSFLTGDGLFFSSTPEHVQSFIKFIASRFRVSPAFNSLPLISLLSVASAVSSEAHPVLSDIQPLSRVCSEDRGRRKKKNEKKKKEKKK